MSNELRARMQRSSDALFCVSHNSQLKSQVTEGSAS